MKRNMTSFPFIFSHWQLHHTAVRILHTIAVAFRKGCLRAFMANCSRLAIRKGREINPRLP